MRTAISLLELVIGALRAASLYNDGLLLTAAMAFSVVYFVLNTVLATAVIHLKRNQPMVLREVLANFGWVALAYAGSATVASLLFLTVGQSGPGVLMAVVPIVGLLLATLAVALFGPAAPGADALWWAASLAQFGVTLWVLAKWISGPAGGANHKPNWGAVTPVLFIPIVGNVLAPLAGVPLGHGAWASAQFGLGLLFFLAGFELEPEAVRGRSGRACISASARPRPMMWRARHSPG